jgi:hypothetical protein
MCGGARSARHTSGWCPAARRAPQVGEFWGRDARRLGIFPLSRGRTYLFCSVPIGEWDSIRDHRLEAWISSWNDFGTHATALLEEVDWTGAVYDELTDLRVASWHRGAVFLIGDAAHAMTPNLGQGANSAMVDGVVLIRLLAAARKEPDALARVGARYEGNSATVRHSPSERSAAGRMDGIVPITSGALDARSRRAAQPGNRIHTPSLTAPACRCEQGGVRAVERAAWSGRCGARENGMKWLEAPLTRLFGACRTQTARGGDGLVPAALVVIGHRSCRFARLQLATVHWSGGRWRAAKHRTLNVTRREP